MKRVRFNRNIYSNKAVEETIKVYKDFAKTTVIYKRKYAIVTFWKCKYEEVKTIKEFENYLIGVENQ